MTNTKRLLTLPEELLLLILDRVPVSDLIVGMRRTCTRFLYLYPEVCRRRRSLTIQLGTDFILKQPFWGDYIYPARSYPNNQQTNVMEMFKLKAKYSTLKFNYEHPYEKRICLNKVKRFRNKNRLLTLDTSQAITATFGRISHLQLSLDNFDPDQVVMIMCLFKGWRYTLHSLHVVCHFANWCWDVSRHYRPLLRAINHLANLRILRFCAWDTLRNRKAGPPLDLPILSQLHEFYFYSRDKTDMLHHSLVKYATQNSNLRRIGLESRIQTWHELSTFLLETPPNELATKLTHLSFLDGNGDDDGHVYHNQLSITDYFQAMPSVIFSRLFSLSITMGLLTLRQILDSLASIDGCNLVALKLHIPKAIEEQQLNMKSTSSTQRLSTIKFVMIQIECAPSHQSLNLMCLDVVFPSLELVMVDTGHYQRCSICAFDDHTEPRIFAKRKDKQLRERCEEKLLRALRKNKLIQFKNERPKRWPRYISAAPELPFDFNL